MADKGACALKYTLRPVAVASQVVLWLQAAVLQHYYAVHPQPGQL